MASVPTFRVRVHRGACIVPDMTWRSPARVPPLVDPATVRLPPEPLARLALGGAWRTRALAHSLAHGLRRVPASAHLVVVGRIGALLEASDVLARHPALGDDAERLVQSELVRERLPAAESWAEVALADVLCGGAIDAALDGLRGSKDSVLSAAGALPRGGAFGDAALDVLGADTRNRWCLQILVDRWAASCAQVFGKPGAEGEAALVAARTKPVAAADLLRGWLSSSEERLEAWGLALPDAQYMGIDVPDHWTPSRRAASRREPAHDD
jgi:hypothetical protein